MELYINNNNQIIYPVVKGNVIWTTNRSGSPSELKVTVEAKGLNIDFGNPLCFKWENQDVFYGFIFRKPSNDGYYSITAYDQIRYLKNKDCYNFINMTASEIVNKIATDFMLNTGNIVDTQYKIEKLLEDNKTLYDMILHALDKTLVNTKSMYVLWDQFGKLNLTNIKDMAVNYLLDKDTCETIKNNADIDSDTYNQIKLVKEDKDTKQRKVYMTKDSSNINKWGVLQYYENVDDTNPQNKAEALIQLKNRVKQSLSAQNCIGDVNVRGGSRIMVDIHKDNVDVNNMMIVEKAKHTFENESHKMDLELRSSIYA